MNVEEMARWNLEALRINPYPGRGIVVGLDETGENLVQAYWIMGRSENSRNRVFSHDEKDGRVFTEPADPAKVADPSLIIYNAMLSFAGHHGPLLHVAGDGNQTDEITKVGSVSRVLPLYWYDKTPRIMALCHWDTIGEIIAEMSFVRESRWKRNTEMYLCKLSDIERGFGFCITTYSGDGNPLPAFHGEPRILPLVGDIRFIADMYWEVLNDANKVALAVKFIPKHGLSQVVIRNKYKRVLWPTD